MRFSFLNDFVYTLAEVFRLEMGTCVRACIFLSCIIVSVNTLIVIEINIVYIIRIFSIITSTLVIVVGYQSNVFRLRSIVRVLKCSINQIGHCLASVNLIV